jgi:hypothetical protein
MLYEQTTAKKALSNMPVRETTPHRAFKQTISRRGKNIANYLPTLHTKQRTGNGPKRETHLFVQTSQRK